MARSAQGTSKASATGIAKSAKGQGMATTKAKGKSAGKKKVRAY